MQTNDGEIHMMPEPNGLFAGALLARAKEFFAAYDLAAQAQHPIRFAECFLYAHVIELSLKAYLAAQGVPKSDLRRQPYSHDIVFMLDRCKEKGLPPVENLSAYIHHTAEMNRQHDFRYPSSYRLTFPNWHDARPVLVALLGTIGPVVDVAAMDAGLHFAADTRHLRGRKVQWSD